VAQTTANADAILKEYYLTPIREQLNQRCVLMFAADDDEDPGGVPSSTGAEGSGQKYDWRGFTRESEGVQFAGREWVLPAHMARNEGLGAIVEGGPLPTAGQQGWTDLKDRLHHNLGSIRLSRYAIKLSERQPGVFLRLLEAETKGMVMDIRKDVNRQGFSSQTGALAAVTADGANSVTVDSVQFLRVNMVIDLVDFIGTPGTILAATRLITAINASTKVVTYSGADVTATTNHRLVRTGSYGNEINGLGNMITNTAGPGPTYNVLHGVDASAPANNWWNSAVFDGGNNPFSEDQGQQVVDRVGASGQAEVELIVSTRGVRRRYVGTLKSQKRFTDSDSVTLRGGFKAILFNEMPMVFDDDCPKGSMWFLNADAMMWIYLDAGQDGKGGWNWVDDDGAILARAVDRTDNFDAYLAADHDFATVGRNRLGRLINLQDDAASVWS
jgi:hypothetical protein